MNNDNEFTWAHSVKGDLHNVIDIIDHSNRLGWASFTLNEIDKHLDKANRGLLEIRKCLNLVKEDEPKETKASKARTRKTGRNHRRR